MASYEYELAPPPNDARARELWLQHAAGFIFFEDARAYALDKIRSSATKAEREVATKAVDDALYGLMMIIDGVTGALRNKTQCVNLSFAVELTTPDGETETVNLREGDGMCMGIHGWRQGDFGENPLVLEDKREKPE